MIKPYRFSSRNEKYVMRTTFSVLASRKYSLFFSKKYWFF